jgi:transposase, IS30 family
LALTLMEREDISRGIASGEAGRCIAHRLGRAASTVSREITRHGGRCAYRAKAADEGAWDAALRPKTCLLALNRTVRNLVASKLVLEWSPEQISGWLKDEFPDDESIRVSHETIYRSLFIQARGVACLKKSLSAIGGPNVDYQRALSMVSPRVSPVVSWAYRIINHGQVPAADASAVDPPRWR